MKNLSFVLLLICTLFVGMPAAEAVVRPVNPENTTTTVEKKELTKKEARKERRMKRKAVKKELKQAIRDWKKEGATSTNTLLLVILAILLPPLAVGIYEGGLTSRFWISLLLTLLFYLPGLIYALIVILE
ncbi:YqaE/Pmp3 family membrane protein [Flavilitoribacter nigricans]|nr:YqaE/Pmp3 family membrane protein [Flavilitoribacter nigricans]